MFSGSSRAIQCKTKTSRSARCAFLSARPLLVLDLLVLEVRNLRERLEGTLLGARPLLQHTARLSESLATAYRFGLRQGVKGVLRLDGRLL